MKKLILGFVIILSMIFLSAYADGITDYPPLPEIWRRYFILTYIRLAILKILKPYPLIT